MIFQRHDTTLEEFKVSLNEKLSKIEDPYAPNKLIIIIL